MSEVQRSAVGPAPLVSTEQTYLPPPPDPVSIRPAPIDKETDLKLPSVVNHIVLGGGGRFMILHFGALGKLGVFDANEVRLIYTIDLPEPQALFAAGMAKLFVYLPKAGVVRRYDLVSGAREAERPFPVPAVRTLVMGHASAGPLFVGVGETAARVFDAATLAEVPAPAARWEHDRIATLATWPSVQVTDAYRLWVAANGRSFGSADRHGNGVQVLRFEPTRVNIQAQGAFTTYVQPSPDGRFLFAGWNGPVTADLQPTPNLVESGLAPHGRQGTKVMFFPAAHGPYYLRLDHQDETGIGNWTFNTKNYRWVGDAGRGEIAVYLPGLKAPLARVQYPLLAFAGRDWLSFHNLPAWVVLIPQAKLLVMVAGVGDRLRLTPLDIDALAEQARPDLPVAISDPPSGFRPGTGYRYPVRARSEGGLVRVSLASGPPGMTVGDDGLLTWPVPAAFPDRQTSVVLELRDMVGKESVHAFTLYRTSPGRPRASEPPPDPGQPAKAGPTFPLPPPRLPFKPPQLTERSSYRQPDSAERIVPGGGGRFLVIYFRKLRKVGVFDVTDARIVRYIDLPEDPPTDPAKPSLDRTFLSAGMTRLVVYHELSGVIERYNLLTGKREGSRKLEVGTVKEVSVGTASEGPIAVSTDKYPRLLDLATLAEIPYPIDEKVLFGGRAEISPVTAAPNGRVFVGTSAILELDGDRVRVRDGIGSTIYCKPSADGHYFFLGTGPVRTIDGQPAADVVAANPNTPGGLANTLLLPAADGPFYFRVVLPPDIRVPNPKPGTDLGEAIDVYLPGADQPFTRVGSLTDVPDWFGLTQWRIEESIHLIPRAKLLVTFPPARDRMLLVPVDLDKKLDESGLPFLYASSTPPGTFCPGTAFHYPVRVRSSAGGVNYELASGPDGMKIEPDGTLTWMPAAAFDKNEVSVILTLRDKGKKEVFHTFRLVRSDKPEEYTPDPEPAPPKPAKP